VKVGKCKYCTSIKKEWCVKRSKIVQREDVVLCAYYKEKEGE